MQGTIYLPMQEGEDEFDALDRVLVALDPLKVITARDALAEDVPEEGGWDE